MKTNLKAARQRVHDLKEARKAQLAKLDVLLAIEGRDLTADEQAQHAAALKELDKVNADLEAAEAKLKIAEQINESERATPGMVIREAILDKPWGSLGEQLQAIARAQSAGGSQDPRLVAAASGASVGGDGGVSFLIQSEYSTQLIEAAVEESVLAPMCTPLVCGEGTDKVELPYIKETSRATGSRYGGVQVFWRKEAGSVNPKMPEIALKELPVEEMMGLAYATDRTLRDATLLESIFNAAFAAEFAFKIDDSIFRGNGAGQMLGIISSAGPRVKTSKQNNQAADSLTARNLSDMWVRLPARAKARATWFINGELGPQLDELYVPVGASGKDPRVVTYDATGAVRIKGRPVVEIEQASAPGDEGDIVVADMSQYLLLRKGGLQQAMSMHVRFIYGENTFRWIQAINGCPATHSAIEPYKGTVSKSPFVTLEDR